MGFIVGEMVKFNGGFDEGRIVNIYKGGQPIAGQATRRALGDDVAKVRRYNEGVPSDRYVHISVSDLVNYSNIAALVEEATHDPLEFKYAEADAEKALTEHLDSLTETERQHIAVEMFRRELPVYDAIRQSRS